MSGNDDGLKGLDGTEKPCIFTVDSGGADMRFAHHAVEAIMSVALVLGHGTDGRPTLPTCNVN